jgi:hypothetical protein
VFVLVVAVASPAAARGRKKSSPPRPKPTSSACEQPCTHVEDCPKVTCECADASGSGVAACDTENTHCCASATTACRRFCEMHGQKWTGRYAADAGDATPPPEADGAAKDESAPATPAPCAETCDKAEDCRTMTCQCAHGAAENVAACDPKGHCCAGPGIVCAHFCGGKKGKWTGKVIDAAPPPDAEPPPEPPDADFDDDPGGYLLRP